MYLLSVIYLHALSIYDICGAEVDPRRTPAISVGEGSASTRTAVMTSSRPNHVYRTETTAYLHGYQLLLLLMSQNLDWPGQP